MNRKFVRISLGGVRDEAEIRGHRRTYIGAMPGRIVQALKQAGSMNPVFMLDEMDKLAAGFQGDPAAALLEVLDPAQNHSFRDHYLEVPFDLSQRAVHRDGESARDAAPGAADRMEIIQLAGYTEEEKLHIARRFLIPRQLSEHGLAERRSTFTDAALRAIIRSTRAKPACGTSNGRSAPSPQGRGAHRRRRQRVEAPAADGRGRARTCTSISVRRGSIARRRSGPRARAWPPALAWTEAGGDVLFIEASLLPGGNQNIILTGQLGNVMQESARAAVSHIRAARRVSSASRRISSTSTTSTSTCPPAPFRKTAPRQA